MDTQHDVTALAQALHGLPVTLDTPAHVYTMLCERFSPDHAAARPPLRHDKLRLYVHVPFCRYKCAFCNFAIRVGASDEQMREYVRALQRELEWVEPGTRLSQLFVGGGTPTALPPALLDELLAAAFERVDSSGSKVHTCESSPETVTAAHAEVMLRHGIGRVSMGVQSLNESVLDGITRRHSPQQAEDAIRMLVGTGLIVNVDLIYGLPGQDEAGFRRDLHRVAELGVHALTLYDLRVGERTQVGMRLDTRERLDLERLLRWRTFVRDTAAEAGFVQTRWHTFKRKESIARNHRWMPTFDDESLGFQLGVGNSARSHLGAAIYRNVDAVRPYTDRVMAGQSPVEQIFLLDEQDRRALYVSRSIGDGGAIDREHYQSSFGLSFDDDHGERIARLRETGLVSDDGNRIGLTELGKLVHDRVTLSFYPERGLAQLRQREQRIDARILTARERAAAH